MKEKLLYILWGCMFVLCVALGTIEAPEGPAKVALVLIALVFFVPGGILLYDAVAGGNRKGVLRIRWISLTVLVLTLVTMIAFILTGVRGLEAAQVLYEVLILVSCPMVCGQYWLISLFLWAGLLSASFIKTDRR